MYRFNIAFFRIAECHELQGLQPIFGRHITDIAIFSDPHGF
jgi:hypothetical protein